MSIARKVKRAGAAKAKPNGEMVFIPAGEFTMGSDRHYDEERPTHRVRVDGFFIDKTLVTNAAFRRFVRETGYITFAEIAPDPKDYPGALPHMLRAGSLVFVKSQGPVDLTNWSNWWTFGFGGDWRHPYGPGSSIKGLDDHPVVHISFRDAEAYAKWASKELPTEAEWEFAARGGLDDAQFAWGDQFEPNGKPMANTWQGEFPWQNLLTDGYEGTSPVGNYPPNGYGLYDMIGRCGNGPPTGMAQVISSRNPAACPSTREALAQRRVTIPANLISRFRAK